MKVFANIQSVSALAKAKMESAGMGVVFNMDSLKEKHGVPTVVTSAVPPTASYPSSNHDTNLKPLSSSSMKASSKAIEEQEKASLLHNTKEDILWDEDLGEWKIVNKGTSQGGTGKGAGAGSDGRSRVILSSSPQPHEGGARAAVPSMAYESTTVRLAPPVSLASVSMTINFNETGGKISSLLSSAVDKVKSEVNDFKRMAKPIGQEDKVSPRPGGKGGEEDFDDAWGEFRPKGMAGDRGKGKGMAVEEEVQVISSSDLLGGSTLPSLSSFKLSSSNNGSSSGGLSSKVMGFIGEAGRSVKDTIVNTGAAIQNRAAPAPPPPPPSSIGSGNRFKVAIVVILSVAILLYASRMFDFQLWAIEVAKESEDEAPVYKDP